MSNNIPNNEENSDEIETNVQIFSNKDEKLKCLGKMLNSDSSRAILLLLIEKEMTANEIADQTKQSLSLVIHHLNKMMQANIVTINKITSNTKNQPMKYYTAKSGIIILPEKVVEKAKESKLFLKSLKTIMKFAVIGVVATISFFVTRGIKHSELDGIAKGEIPDPNAISPLVFPLIIIIIGLLIMYFRKKNN